MRGVSEVIAIILILMITISLAGLAYMFMSTTMSDVTASAGSTVDTTTSSMFTSFTIESMDVAKVYVRNTGQSALTSLSVYVNDEPAVYNITPSSIAAGAVGTITIYSFIPDGGTIKITSPSGFSASKMATPCAKAVGCWKFDEGTGTTAYDSSNYGNTGTMVNGANYTTGRYGSAVQFDGSNDYVNAGNASSLNPSNAISVSALVYPSTTQPNAHPRIVAKESGHVVDVYALEIESPSLQVMFYVNGTGNYAISSNALAINAWSLVTGVYNGTHIDVYINGVLEGTGSYSRGIPQKSWDITIGNNLENSRQFNGTIDEVRIYNRAIY